MTQRSKTQFAGLYGSSGTIFPDNTTGDISEADIRAQGEDIKDSFVNITDGLIAAPSNAGAVNTGLQSLYSCYARDVNITSSQILSGNSTAITIVSAPASDYVIVPVMFFIGFTWNSVQYATNTTFRFEINGIPVSNTNTSILPSIENKWVTMLPIEFDTDTDMRAQALKLEVQTGNPTAGNSIMNVTCIYKITSWGLIA